MARSRWKGGLPRTVRKEVQRKQRNARRREAYAKANPKPVVGSTLFDWNKDNLEVAHVYTKNSKVMPSPKGYAAVKLKNGQKGYVKIGGNRFIGDEENLFIIASIEKAAHIKGTFTGFYNRLDAAGKARFMERVADIDWTAFWKVHYNQRTGLLDYEAVDMMESIMFYATYGKEL